MNQPDQFPSEPPPPPPEATSPPPPPAAASTTTGLATGSEGEPAGALIRLGARLIDGVAVFLAAFVAGFIVGFVMGALQLGGIAVVTGAIGAAIGVGYFVVFEVTTGATPAKHLLGLRVVRLEGGNPTVQESLLRNFFTFLGIGTVLGPVVASIMGVLNLLIFIAIGLTIANYREKRGFHDRWAGTAVRRV